MNEQLSYAELKAYFTSAELPYTLNAKDKYYLDVKKTVGSFTEIIETELATNKNPSRLARLYKYHLNNLYNELKIKDDWNELKPINNQHTVGTMFERNSISTRE